MLIHIGLWLFGVSLSILTHVVVLPIPRNVKWITPFRVSTLAYLGSDFIPAVRVP
jgi:hypothetical protein